MSIHKKIISHTVLLYIASLLICSSELTAQGRFDYNKDIQDVYRNIISLKLDLAKTQLADMAIEDPENLARYHMENYVDFFTIFINEDEHEYKQLKKQRKKRIKAIQRGDKQSPYYLFTQAEINLQWALTSAKFGEQFNALKEIYSSYRDLKQNETLHPEFQENKKSLSVIHAVNETIPIPKMLKKLFSLQGSIERGEKEIKELLDYASSNQSMFYEEAIASYVVILLYQKNEKDKAYKILNESKLDPSSSPLVSFLYAKIAQRAGYNEAAITALEASPSSADYMRFDYLDFLMGLSKIRKLDEDADVYLKRFVKNFRGRLYLKEAYQKLAWYELVIKDDVTGYKKYIELVGKVGTEIVDDDKQAMKELESGQIPNPELLKARLLFDGGYNQRSYDHLARNKHKIVYNDELELEYNYRIGRATQALKNFPDALLYFAQTIDKGSDSPEYYACNAALQMGIIYEELGVYGKAKKYFELCIDLSPNEYKTSLHQKAKTGKDRIKNKKSR